MRKEISSARPLCLHHRIGSSPISSSREGMTLGRIWLWLFNLNCAMLPSGFVEGHSCGTGKMYGRPGYAFRAQGWHVMNIGVGTVMGTAMS
jgi:hypothetical protein